MEKKLNLNSKEIILIIIFRVWLMGNKLLEIISIKIKILINNKDM